MLEHVEDPRAVIENIYAIANQETRIILSVPIETPKLVVKDVLSKVGLFNVLFPGIEEGQSEGHLHAFSVDKLRDITSDLFEKQRQKGIWGIHYVVHLRKLP